MYKWSSFPGDPSDLNFVKYEDFMKDYNPLLTRIVPHDVAAVWLDKVLKFYRTLFATEEKYIDKCKELDL